MEREAALVGGLSHTHMQAQAIAEDAMAADTVKKLEKAKREVQGVEYRARAIMGRLAQLSNDVHMLGAHSFEEKWSKFAQILVAKSTVVVLAHRLLIRSWADVAGQEKLQIEQVNRKIAAQESAESAIAPGLTDFQSFESAKDTSADLHRGLEALSEERSQLMEQKPASYRPDNLESEEQAVRRVDKALTEQHKVVIKTYKEMEEELHSVEKDLQDIQKSLEEMDSKLRGFQELGLIVEDAIGHLSPVGHVGQDEEEHRPTLDGVVDTAVDLGQGLSPIKPFQDLAEAVQSGKAVSTMEWIELGCAIGLEIVAWEPTPLAGVTQALKVGRAGFKAFKAMRKGAAARQGPGVYGRR